MASGSRGCGSSLTSAGIAPWPPPAHLSREDRGRNSGLLRGQQGAEFVSCELRLPVAGATCPAQRGASPPMPEAEESDFLDSAPTSLRCDHPLKFWLSRNFGQQLSKASIDAHI